MQDWLQVDPTDQLKQEPHIGCYIVEVAFVASVGAAHF